MIGTLAALAALAAAPVQPGDSAHIRCAFAKAGELASSTAEPAELVAQRVVAACTADSAAGPASDPTRLRIRAAAIAMVNRKRGTDGQAPDAPIRLPTLETRVSNGFDIPDEIAPAILPYLQCRIASAGVALYDDDRDTRIAPVVGKGVDCAPWRKQAARDADRLLRERGGMSKARRAEYIERILAGADVFHRASALPPQSSESHAEH
ncbi:MAG TPA: hypothetical protein VFZ91_15470 [Allosphingosinicella sp.]